MNAYEQAKLGEALQNYYKASKGNEIAFDLFIHRHFVKGVADTLFNGYKMVVSFGTRIKLISMCFTVMICVQRC